MEKQENTIAAAYKTITQKIVMRLADGDIPWRKKWFSPFNQKINYVSRKPYNGVNLLMLDMPGEYMTFAQALHNGGSVRRGEHGTPVFKWIPFIPKDKKEEARKLEEQGLPTDHLLAFKTGWDMVFHLSQTDGIKTKTENGHHEEAARPTDIASFAIERFTDTHDVRIKELPVDEISFDAASRTVNMPGKQQFEREEQWYAAAFAALIRYGMDGEQQPKKDAEAQRREETKQELASIIGGAMCLAATGLDNSATPEEAASECARWMPELNRDFTLIVKSASAAQKAAEVIMRPVLG